VCFSNSGKVRDASFNPSVAGNGGVSMAISKWSHVAFSLLLCLALANIATSRLESAGAQGSRIRIAFAGDSLVDNYWSGMTRVVAANPCLRNAVELGRFAHNGTGLTRGDRLYWPREIRRIGETFKPTVFVLSVGLNDRQFIVDGKGARTAWGSPDWIEKYRNEINELIKGAADSNAVVLWVGLPSMRDSLDNTDAIEKDKMYADAVAKFGAKSIQYVEPWKLKATGGDTYSSFGPDRNGKLQQIRTTDGQHFTTAGEDLLAAFIYPKIFAALSEVGIALGQCSNPERGI
jgi:uncharacterized protein